MKSELVATSLAQSQLINIHKFILFIKKDAHFYAQIQSYKRQLASFLNSINYTLPFSILDIERKGRITQQNIQKFLISCNYYHKPVDIHRYFQKYTHGKQSLSYQDIVECLVPHSDYILMASTAKNITETFYNKQFSQYLCKNAQNQIVKKIVAVIINAQVEFIKKSFSIVSDLTLGSLRFGAQLWRHLDRNHDNCLNFQRMKHICSDFGYQLSQSEWESFINWNFRSHKKQLKRNDFMIIFDGLIENKRNGSACNFQNFVQSQVQRKAAESYREKLDRVASIVKERVQKCERDSETKLSSSLGKSKLRQISMVNPEEVSIKTLLQSKIGYRNPEKLIKMSEITK